MEEADAARPSKRSEGGLDWLNFFITSYSGLTWRPILRARVDGKDNGDSVLDHHLPLSVRTPVLQK
jgi:hypothetical protein